MARGDWFYSFEDLLLILSALLHPIYYYSTTMMMRMIPLLSSWILLLLFPSIAAAFSTQKPLLLRRAPTFPRSNAVTHLNPYKHFSTILFATNNTESSTEESSSSSLTSEIEPELESTRVGRELLLPLAQVLEDSTDGWALEYADLAPETETTPVGLGFLSTNLAYTLVGLLLVQSGNVLLGVLTELASVASFAYHFCQLKLGKNQPLVRVALLVDYVVATATLLAALVYIIQVGIENVPLEGIVASVLAVVFLFLSWVWEEGIPYVINHGLWHLLGAYAGLMIGQAQMRF